MNVGYVRLSRDDDKRNYVSIENQKLIISQFAAKCNMVIDRWYEDDGVSGYIFNRPGLNQLMDDLDKDIDRVFVKDLSRVGRHNAKVLLLLEDFKERKKELIVVDTNYNSETDDDDTIGITTWYNEKYVKDISRKIKRALEARQKEGILMTQPPFGYKRNEIDKSKIEIIPKEAEYVKMVYDLYLKGSGYRMIANYLTENKVPTPSMVRHERELEEGKITKRQIATVWSDSMVKDMLGNDFYIGTLRLRKRARSTVHGKDKRVPKDEQYVFENHHPAIIDKASFDLIQDMKEKRVKNNYRGSRGQWIGSEIPNPFGSCLFCKDCGRRLTPIRRTTSSRERKYYICTTYNIKGKRYCSKSHLTEEEDLMEDVVTYINGKLYKDEDTRKIVEDAYDFYFSCYSIRKTYYYITEKYASHPKAPTYNMIDRLFKNEKYAGTVNGVENFCEGYITTDQFRRIRQISQTKTAPGNHTYLFSSLIKCPVCGAKLSGYRKQTKKPNGKIYSSFGYRCCNKYRRHSSPCISENVVERYMISNVLETLAPELLTLHTKVREKAAPSTKLRDEINRLNLLFQKGRICEEYYEKQYLELENKLTRIPGDAPPENCGNTKNTFSGSFADLYRALDKEHKQAFWKTCIKQILIDKETHKLCGFSFLT